MGASTVPLPATFLPLCGDGKLDTIASYNAITDRSKSTFPATIANAAVNVTLFATETCDDGNRMDWDGCSADCMNRDLWVSSCKLQLDTDLKDPETIAYIPQKGMLLSTATNLYLIASMPSVNDVQVKLQNLGAKAVKVTNFMVTKQGTLAWSAQKNTVYLVNFQGGNIETLDPFITVDLTNTGCWDRSYLFENKDIALFHDTYYIAVYNLTSKQKVGEFTSNTSLVQAMYIGNTQKDIVYLQPVQTNDRLSVQLKFGTDQTVSGIACDYSENKITRNNIWADAFDVVAYTSLMTSTPYDMTVAGAANYPTPGFMTFYSPLGLWSEMPLTSPRNWLKPSVDQSKLLSTNVGNVRLFNAGTDQANINCDDESNPKCVYKFLSPNYDLLVPSTNPSGTWLEQLKSITSSLTFPNINYQSDAYKSVLKQWTELVTIQAAKNQIKEMAVNQVTGNTWLLRSDGIFEISRSGVILRVSNTSDNCMPSGVALCKPCYWAQAGSPCKSCITSKDTSSWAWSVQCQNCISSGRRLLQDSNHPMIKFTYIGKSPDVALKGVTCASSLISIPQQAGSYDISIYTSDPQACMRELMPALADVDDVIVRPYVIILVPNIQSTDATMPEVYQILIGIFSVLALVCVFTCCVLCYRYDLRIFSPLPFAAPYAPNRTHYQLFTQRQRIIYQATPLQTYYPSGTAGSPWVYNPPI